MRSLIAISLSVTLLPFVFAAPQPIITPTPVLVDRQATVTTLFGTCHTSFPTDNVPRGICTITSPTDSPFLGLGIGCNTGSLSLRLTNCTSDGSVSGSYFISRV